MDLTPAVGKSEAASTVVLGSRHIRPLLLGREFDKEAVVDAVRMFVKEDDGVGWIDNRCRFEELALSSDPGALAVAQGRVVRAVFAHEGVHRVAADPARP